MTYLNQLCKRENQQMLTDNHGRNINYLRLAVTDRCNLRCLYCMPAGGLNWVPRKDLLSYEEIMRLLKIFYDLGITKLRFTGGEPFLRKDFVRLTEEVSSKNWFNQISITTNGTLTAPHVERMKEIGIHSVNLSLDTMDRKKFNALTRRNDFDEVMRTFDLLLKHGIETKINAVIVEGQNDDDIVPLAELTKQFPVDVRFIEEMPFNGVGERHAIKWNFKSIIEELKQRFPDMSKIVDGENSTSLNYHIPGHAGNVGVIAAWTRSFCGTCNRIRLTPKGTMKTCLYDNGKADLLSMLREGHTDESIALRITHIVNHRAKDGFEAEAQRNADPVSESMATIGG